MLTVVAKRLSQVAPDTATIVTGKPFSGQLKVSGASGSVTYAQSDRRAPSQGLVLRQDLGSCHIDSWDLQGHRHRERPPR